MKFPVDLLADVSQAELEQLAHNYMNNLLYSNPDSPEHLTLSDSTQVTIDISSVGFVPLYGSSDKQKILALFSLSDPFTAVALYLLDQWWPVDDILKTADPARDGAVEVETVGERIVLYILNRVIYRAKEMSSEELPFLCHGEKDNAKILWNNGEAVGFYSVKPSGSLCNSFSTRSYQLPVMDSIFVRKCQRGKGFGLQMLEDFVLSFKEDCLGLRYPLTKSMYKVCEKYLCQYPGDTDLLWEVESIGGPNQRTNIASKIQAMDLSAVSKSLSFTEESLVITEVTEKDVVMEAITTQIKKAESMECTVEIVEEMTVLRATKVSEAEVPVAARGRSSGSKRRKMGEKITEDKSEKVIRIEDIEAETPREEQVSAQQKTELHVSELVQTEGMYSVAPEEKGEDVVDTAPEAGATTMSDKPATVLQDLEEADVTLAPTTQEPQVEDDATQDLSNTSHDSQIPVENVASEIEEAVEECQKENTAVLVVSEEVLEVHNEAETLNKVGEGTQIEVTDEKSEERVTQHEVSLSTHATSEDGEAGKKGRTDVKAIKTVQSETPRRRSQRHRKPEEGVKEDTTAQDGGRVLRGRTVMSDPKPKRKYTRHSQKVCEELEKEVDEVAEENEVSMTVVEKLAVTEGGEPEEITSIKEDVVAVEELREEEKQQLKDEQLTKEEETEKQGEPGVEDTALSGSSVELPFTTETALTKENEDEKDESEKEQKCEEVETSVLQDKQEVTPKPKPTKQSKRHQKQEEEHTDEADLGAGGSGSRKKADEKATDKQMGEHHQVEQEETVDKTEEEISTKDLTVVEEGTIPKAEEAGEDIIPSTEVNVEEHKEIQEEEETEGETEIVSVMEVDKEEEADDMIEEPDTVAAASETVLPDEVLDEAVVPVAEESQEKDTGSEIPMLQKATVILVDLKTTCHHLSVKEAEETPVGGECAVPEKEQMELIAAEEKEVSSCVAEEQTPEPEILVLEEEGGEKQENSTEKSVDATAEAETVEKQELEEDNSDKKEESANVDEEKSEAEEAPVIETRVLRSGRKTVEASCKSTSRSNQQQEEDNMGDSITEKEVDEAKTGTVEVEGEMEAMAKDAITVRVPVEEKQSAVSEICADIKADIPVVDDAEENLPPAEVDEAMSVEDEEAPVVETRALRSGTKTVTTTPRHKTTRSRKQMDEQETENSEEEEPAMTIRTLRQGRILASAKSRRTRKQIQEQVQKGEEESKRVEETGVEEEEAVKEAAVENTDKERQEKSEEEIGERVKEEAASEREESLEPEIDVEEGKAVAEEGQDVVEEQSEAISKTFAEREVDASGEECDERKPVMGGEEVELPPVAVTRSLRIGGKISKAPPKTRSRRSKKQQDEEKEEGGASAEKSADGDEAPAEPRILRRGRKSVCRKRKQLQKEEEGPKESAEEAEVEEEAEEAGLGSAEEPPTEGDEGKAPGEDKIEVEEEELVTVEVESRVSEEGTMTMTEEEENTAGVTAAAYDLVQEGETDTALPKLTTDSAILTPGEEEATPSAEEQLSEEMAPQLSDLQRVTVVLVDLKKTHHSRHQVQEETAAVDEGVPVEKTAAEAEEEQREETTKEEKTMAEEHVPGSPVVIEKTELEKVVVEEEGFEEKVEDAVTIQDIWEGRAKETAKEDEAESVDDDEKEPTVIESRTRRSRKQAVKATPRRKLARSRQKKVEEEKEEASEIREEEPAVQVRILRMERKSIPVTQKCTTKRTHKQLQEEEEEGGEESTAVGEREAEEEEEQAEEQQQMIDQEMGERLEEKDATQQVENIEPEMGVEKVDTVAEEAVIQQDAPEEGQAGSTETAADEDAEAPVGQSANEGKTLDDVAEEAVTTQDTMEGEQSTSTSEVAETAAGESAQETLLTAKDDEAKGVSEEEEAPVITETRVLRSGEKTVRTRTRSKTTKRQDDEQEEEATGEKSTEGDEPAVETRVLRKGRRSAVATARRKSKRARTQCETEEEGEDETTQAKEMQVEETKAVPKEAEEKEESRDEKIEEKNEEEAAAQKEENTEPEVEMEKVEAAAEKSLTQQETVEEEQSAVSETCADGQGEASVRESAEETPNTDEGEVTDEEEAPTVETRLLRSGEKTVRATPQSKTTKRQDYEQEEEAAGEKSTEKDELAVETRVLRKGRRSDAATRRRKSKRARTQCQTEEEGEKETTQAEEIQVEETKADEKEDKSDEKIEEKDGKEAAAQEENTEPEVEMAKVGCEAVAEKSLTGQETVEEEESAVSETCLEEEEPPVGEGAEETPNTDDGEVADEEEAPVVETRVLRSDGKAVKATPRPKTTKSQQEENEQEGTVVEKSGDMDEPAVETRVLRKGKRSAPATPSKKACTQCQPEEEGEDKTSPAEETEGEEEEAGQELPEQKGEKAKKEGKSMEMEMKKERDVEEQDVESAAGGESAVGDAEQMKDASTEEAAVLEKEDNSVTAVDETGTDMVEISSAKVEETNSAEEEETKVIEKSTAATEVGSDTATAEQEALVEDQSVVAEEEAPAVTTRTLRSKTKTSHATTSPRSRRQKDQGVVETQQQEEETPEDEETQEVVYQFTDDSPENRELNAKEQAETEEASPTGQEAGPPAEDTAEDQAKETADLIDDRVVEPTGEEPATEETESPGEEPSESKEDKTVDSSVVEGRSLRRKMKTVADKEEHKAEEIQLPKRRSIRKRPRVDYRENEEDEGGETEAATDKEEEDKVESDEDKDNKKAGCSADEPIEKLEESSRQENLENNMGVIESTSEKGGVLNLVLDTDEEVETAGLSQENEEDEQNMSEEEVESIVIGKRVLRGRSVPSVIITPQSNSRRCSAKVQKVEESLSDEEKSPQSAQKRSLRKRKSTEVTPTRKSKRHSKV